MALTGWEKPIVLVLKMRQSPIKNLLLFGVLYLGVFCSQSLKGATAQCDTTFSDEEGEFTLSVSSSTPVCNVNISGPNNSVVLLSFSVPNDTASNGVTLEISDQWASGSTLLYKYTNGVVEVTDTNLYSFSSDVLLALEGNGEDFQLDFSYTIEDRSNSSTMLSNGSGKIQVTGDSSNSINFQHTWHISAGEDNFLYFFIENVTLDDAAGDFLVLGTGSEVFAEAPALMLTGSWHNYPIIHLNGTEGYISLFMKSYSPDLGVTLFYDTWLYTPPTLFPPFTKPQLQIIDAYFYFDDGKDNYHDVVTNFTKYVEKYAYEYCAMEPSTSGKGYLPDYPLVLDVEVAQVVETDPCLVVEFYVDVMNGTCLKNISFTSDDFRWLLGNYSDQFSSDFGREVMQSCPMKLLWVLAVVIIVFVTLLILIFVIFKSKDMDLTKSMFADDEEDRDDEEVQESGSNDEQPCLTQIQDRQESQQNHYAIGQNDQAPRMGSFLNSAYYDDTGSVKDDIELTLTMPMGNARPIGFIRLNGSYSEGLVNDLNHLPPIDGQTNIEYDDEPPYEDIPLYEPVGPYTTSTDSPSTSNHSSS